VRLPQGEPEQDDLLLLIILVLSGFCWLMVR
jgi:hypothetical protein